MQVKRKSSPHTGRKDGFAINLQMCKFVANLTFKFASTLQWLFYYLCDTKFAIHTLMPLRIRKFMGSNLQQICNGCLIIFTISNLQYIHSYIYTYKFIGSNLHQICNGCFVIFTMTNLQYIHTYFCTYANLSRQICIKFARVVYS